jgi:hypothetical protein
MAGNPALSSQSTGLSPAKTNGGAAPSIHIIDYVINFIRH